MAMVSAPNFAQAEDEKGWIGGLFGVSAPTRSDATSRAIYGLTAGAKLGTELGLGVYYLTSPKDENVQGQTIGNNFDFYGIEGAYHFEGEAKGAYIGARIGITNVKIKPSNALTPSVSTTPVHWGPTVGYNYWLNRNFSLGGDVSYLLVSESSEFVGGANATIPAFNALNIGATAKFWF
jgi:hypothetical protein